MTREEYLDSLLNRIAECERRLAAMAPISSVPCGQRAAVPVPDRHHAPAFYTKACILPKGHGTHHRDNDGYTWHETVR